MKARAVFFFLILALSGSAQVLDKNVTITFKNKTLATALEELSNEVGFDYSYNAKLFNGQTKLTKTYQNKTLRFVLDNLLQNLDVEYSVISGQIIFYKKKAPKIKKAENLLNGTVKDGSGEGIEGVRITDPDGLVYKLTDAHGKFSIAVPNPNYTLHLTFQHRNYYAKQLKIQLNSNQELQVVMQAKPYEKIDVTEANMRDLDFYASIDSALPDLTVPSLLIPANVSARNADTLRTRFFAGGLFPPASSKGLHAGNELNHLSVHILTDYGAGIDGFTVSGLASVYRFSANGLSIATLGNYVGGNMAGVQIGGIINTNNLRTDGLQISGILNVTGVRQTGIQLAGLANVNRSNAYGIQLASLANYTHKTTAGLQLSTLFNRSRKIQGLQLALLHNNTRRTQGMQISFVNHARRLDGLQIGLINFADSAKYGGQIGLLNFVKYGYRQIEFSYDEMNFLDFSFRSGIRHFYSFFKVGSSFAQDSIYFRLGYGLGSEIRIVGPLAINLEAEAFHVTPQNITGYTSLLAKGRAGLALNFNSISFFAAYNYNTYVTNFFAADGTTPEIPIITNPEYEENTGDFLVQNSHGVSVGIRFNMK